MDENLNNEFNALTEDLAYSHKIEKMYDTLADRAQFVRVLAMHCGEIYKVARRAGVPRKIAAGMAQDYFSFETTPSGSYYVSGGGL
ncbi:hypothetical protein ACIQHZ_31265 [Streptomyces halstedii]|uniref:hypothetical protein n=1 Tax=Streptomyces halstedii TaxID=1944 RepID=UPI0038251997